MNALKNIYETLANTDDYKKNVNWLRVIHLSVLTVSAVATGFNNAFSHRDRITLPGAILLGSAIAVFVESFALALRQGLTTCYKGGRQRAYAQLCYRLIKITMVLNVAGLCAWIAGFEPPAPLVAWNHWAIVIHFALALVGVGAVRDADPVIENRMLRLKAETAREDAVMMRKAAAVGHPVVLLASKVRGWAEAFNLASKILRSRSSFAADYVKQLDRVADEQFAFADKQDFPAYLPPAPKTPRR